LIPNLWIQQGIANVNEQVDDKEDEGKDEDRGLHDRVVSVLDRIHNPSANAVPDKYGFGQHSAAKECARLKSNDSGDGQPRIPHDVPVINRLLLEAL
jgi:hypothetical protein